MFRSLSFNRIGLVMAALLAVVLLLAACGAPAPATTTAPVVAAPTATTAPTTAPTTAAQVAPTGAPTTAPTTAAPTTAAATTGAPDWTQLGFKVIASQAIPAGAAADINAAPYQIKVPVGTFADPVQLELLTADPSQFAAKAPQGENPVLAFALSITDTQTNQPILSFATPILMTVTDNNIVSQSKYYNVAPDGTFTENSDNLNVEAGLLTHPISGTGVAWVITAPGAAPAGSTSAPDWTQLGFPTVLASQDITP